MGLLVLELVAALRGLEVGLKAWRLGVDGRRLRGHDRRIIDSEITPMAAERSFLRPALSSPPLPLPNWRRSKRESERRS